MWESFLQTLQTQMQNQFVSGGLTLAGLIIGLFHKLWPVMWGFLKRCFVVTAVIDSRNDVFQSVIKWLNSLPYSRKTHYFFVTQENSNAAKVGRIPELLYSPAPGWHVLRRGRKLIWINRSMDSSKTQPIETLTISMLFARRSDFESLIQDIVAANYGQMIGRTQLFTPDSWADEWRLHTTKPKRDIQSVVLPEGVREKIVRDVQEFHQNKERYESLGIPWRRGYLLYGPPGTGKTSLVFALAGQLDLNICTLSLMHRRLNDQNLADLLQASPPGSIILLEDVDSFFQARDKTDAKMEVSFSGLLNALDGVAAQEGRVVFMTTNHRGLLDPALIRPGRIDVAFELGAAGREELRRMIERFFPNVDEMELCGLLAEYEESSLTPAEVQQMLQDATDAPAGLKALAAKIKSTAL
jgi:mitochondrial chaperone BCS1